MSLSSVSPRRGLADGRPPVAGSRQAVLGWVTAAAGCCYSLFLIAPLLGSRLDPARSYVSELAALDQPASTVFRLIDMVVGVVVAVAGLVAARAGRRRWGWAGLWFAVFGIGTVLDSAAPMSCAPSSGSGCPVGEGAGLADLVGAHELTSLISNVAVLVAMALVTRSWWSRRGAGLRATVLQRACVPSLPVAAVTGLVAVLQATVFGGLGSWVGWAQRVQVLTISIVVVALGVSLLRGDGDR